MKNRQKIIEKMNALGKIREPFFFVIDFNLDEYLVLPIHEISEYLFDINGLKNHKLDMQVVHVEFEKNPISFDEYLKAFKRAQESLLYGDSFLINLTFKTKIKCNLSLLEIFVASKAKYKLYVPGKFVVFSPEIFVQIKNGIISSFPMKGTIDASEPCAKEKIISDPKELAEHTTIVDLIRNDMSIVAQNVHVEKFRYIDEIPTHDKNLLQVSSKICGSLPSDYSSKIGDIICSMLPAGSVTGAPKQKTVDIIKNIENYDRGYYTGVFGYFDGNDLDSGVMIRFIEKEGEEMYFKSGGGITIFSEPKKEYQELIDKIYVPIARNTENPEWTADKC